MRACVRACRVRQKGKEKLEARAFKRAGVVTIFCFQRGTRKENARGGRAIPEGDALAGSTYNGSATRSIKNQ
jgi:hypothetical protein